MSGMNWKRVHWENRFVQAAKEGYLRDEDGVGGDRLNDPGLLPRHADAGPATLGRRQLASQTRRDDHSTSIASLGSKKWMGRCSCGWSSGPRKQSVIKTAVRQHVMETQAVTSCSSGATTKRSRSDAARTWFPTEIGCHVCGAALSVYGEPGGKAAGTRCSSCRMQWVMQRYEATTQEWLQDALDSSAPARRRPTVQANSAPKVSQPPPEPKALRSKGGAPVPRAKACKHRIAEGQCPICNGKGSVYITGGGTRFHRNPSCSSLAKGQEKVIERGGDPLPIEGVVVRSLRLIGRDPCRTCFPVV